MRLPSRLKPLPARLHRVRTTSLSRREGSLRLLGTALMLLGFVAAVGAAHAQAANPFGIQWREKVLADHALVGRVWSAQAGGLVDVADLENQLAAVDFLLVGEVHDNADAHALQGWLIRKRTGGARMPGVVFEHIRTDQAEALARFEAFDQNARRLATAHDLLRFLDWKSGGWPPEDKFLPLYEAVFNPRLPIYAANPPRTQVRAVARGDEAALSGEERRRIGLEAPLEAPLAEALTTELKGSHCGMIPAEAIPAMSLAQRYRDAAFADAMLAAAEKDGATILAAGNGHVRTDRAVPWYLRQRAPDRSILAVMMLEVEAGQTDPEAYVPRAPDGGPAVDFIVFTPRVERADPCAELKEGSKSKG